MSSKPPKSVKTRDFNYEPWNKYKLVVNKYDALTLPELALDPKSKGQFDVSIYWITLFILFLRASPPPVVHQPPPTQVASPMAAPQQPSVSNSLDYFLNFF